MAFEHLQRTIRHAHQTEPKQSKRNLCSTKFGFRHAVIDIVTRKDNVVQKSPRNQERKIQFRTSRSRSKQQERKKKERRTK